MPSRIDHLELMIADYRKSLETADTVIADLRAERDDALEQLGAERGMVCSLQRKLNDAQGGPPETCPLTGRFRVMTFDHLFELAHQRKSVICDQWPPPRRPRPAAVVVNMSANCVRNLLNIGLYVYRKPNP